MLENELIADKECPMTKQYCECQSKVTHPRNRKGKKKWTASKNDHYLCGRHYKPFNPVRPHWRRNSSS